MARSTPEHSDFFNTFLKDKRVIIEIGAGIGKITDLLAERVDLVYAIDQWEALAGDERTAQTVEDCFEVFCINCWDSRLKIIPVEGWSKIVIPWIAEKGINPDAIYVDGSHTYTGFIADLLMCAEHFPNAILFGDDYRWGDMSIYIALQNFSEKGYEITPHVGGMWTAKKSIKASSEN